MDWVINLPHTPFLPHNLPPTKKLFTFFSRHICLQSIGYFRQYVSYQFFSSFSRLSVQEYENDCCLRNQTDNKQHQLEMYILGEYYSDLALNKFVSGIL